ncbi:MAG: response regulator [Firmicutes bacterium]|nr:response regulator [Bacillota bacterium]
MSFIEIYINKVLGAVSVDRHIIKKEDNGLEYIPGAFCGLIGSSVNNIKDNQLKELIVSVINDNGCLISIYNNQKQFETNKYKLISWGLDFDKLIKQGRIIFISAKDDYLENNDFQPDEIINVYKKLLNSLHKRGIKKIVIEGTRDEFYNSRIDMDDLYNFHEEVEKLAKEKSVMILTKYILDSFTEKGFYRLLSLHDMFLIDDGEKRHVFKWNDFGKLKILFKYVRELFIDKRELYEENKKLELLNELIMEISYKQSSDELLNSALKKVSEIVNVDFGYIMTFDNEFNQKVIAKHNIPTGFYDDLFNLDMKLKDMFYYLNKGISLNMSKDIKNECIKDLFNKYYIKSSIQIPINDNNGKITGVILLFTTKKRSLFYRHKPFLEAVRNSILVLLEKQKRNQEYQNNLIKAEKLKALGELSGGIAHDFNNVLTSILGYSQMALLKVNDENIKKYLSVIYNSSLDGKAIVDKIQNFTKKRNKNKKSVFSVNNIVATSLEMARPRWENDYKIKNIDIETKVLLKSNSKILCNQHELREVLLNIILNAMDAMESGGKLILRTYDKEDEAYIEIEDNGSGMPEDIKKKIFEPFFSTKEARGTGLGLSISKNIIKEHKGEIYVESKLGKGTKFTIKLQRYINLEKDNEFEKEDIISSFENIKALVIDDKKKVADSIALMLRELKVNSDVELDSMKAMGKIKNSSYDIVICDLAMPKINGLELAKKIKENNKDIKIILMTGWPGDIEKDNLTIVDYLLEKPCTLNEVSKALEKTVKNV